MNNQASQTDKPALRSNPQPKKDRLTDEELRQLTLPTMPTEQTDTM